ncbi:MAG: type II toxin-antitoxin system HicB family antitoxin [candidate division NC10 bacterium]|nr:type II toxin-antitoxin system HicB family antitoxin [candidate division NC10 bacterium]
MKKDLEHYLDLRYPMEIVEAEEGGYVGRFPDLPGCISQGETIEEVVKSLEDAKRSWIEVRLEDGLEIPPPHEVVEEYSGRFLMRAPKSVHRELATRARREGTSLNQYVLHLLSWALGREQKAQQADAVTTEAVSLHGDLALAWRSFQDIAAYQSTWEAFSGRPARLIWPLSGPRGFAPLHLDANVLLAAGQEEFLTGEEHTIELTDRTYIEVKQKR